MEARRPEYGAAILAVVLAIWLRYGLTPMLGTRLPFVTLFDTVGVAVWVGGVPAGDDGGHYHRLFW